MDRIGELWGRLAETAREEAPFAPLAPPLRERLEQRLALPSAWRERLAEAYPTRDLRLLGKLGTMTLPGADRLVDLLEDDPPWDETWLPLDRSDDLLCLALDLEADDLGLIVVNREDRDEAGRYRSTPAKGLDMPATLIELLEAAVSLREMAADFEWITVRDEEVLAATSEQRLQTAIEEHPNLGPAITAKTRADLAKEWKTERALAALILPVPLFLADAAHSFVTQLWQGGPKLLMLLLIGGLPAALTVYILSRIVGLTRGLAVLKRSA